MARRRNLWYQNLACPLGLFGLIVGKHLADENYEINLWSTAMLNIQPNDRILEIGFGPGLAVQDMVRRATQGFIAGIDYSGLMVASAKLKNLRAVTRGQVDLRHASVCKIPDFGTYFDKVVAINNAMYWPHPVQELKNLRNLLMPGGTISLVIQRNETLLKSGRCNDEIQWYVNCLNEAGFENVGTILQPIVLRRRFSKPDILAGILIQGVNPVKVQTQSESENTIVMLQHEDVSHTLQQAS